ncbi:YhjD/YihY/BrkB family envelope integrity protein [Microlunatus soli]|uniref:Membrane protein n=1 Tax=Microlunatus soli TaxID=630515 RepID=A0A1H2AN06_9ACTN|nr:YhjD/YihY/BrkB family envelope integrity protein [Microlunatus soli]SDT46936.1 membrane protein [Microlunatus soli]
MSELKEQATKITSRPVIAHLLRANTRFGERLGNQFGAAITYFSVLAIVPIIMFAFSVLGFILVVAMPQLMDETLGKINEALGSMDAGTRKSISGVIENALKNYAAIGIVGALSALYSGAGWMGNLKDAVRAQWRPSFDMQVKKQNFLIKTLSNLVILLGLLIMMAVTFGIASVSTALSDNIIGWIGLDDVGWLRPVLKLVPILVSVGAGWLIFMYLYIVLPETREPWKFVRRGALIGAIGLGVLQYLTSFLISKFAGNPAAALFGPVIALMLFFNLFARLILFVAAWIGTAEHPAEPVFAQDPDQISAADAQVIDELPAGAAAAQTDAAAAESGTSGTEAGDRDTEQSTDQTGGGSRPEAGPPQQAPEVTTSPDDPRGPWSKTPGLVPTPVAARSVKIGTRAGYLVGVATGVGAGSVIAQLIRKLPRRR